MNIRMQILLPIFIFLFVLFATAISYLIIDQSNTKNKELAKKIENTTQLVTMTNVSNLWNIDNNALEQNITSFLNDKEIVSIDIKDTQGTSMAKKSNQVKEKLISRKGDIERDGSKIGSAEIVFTDFYIREAVGTLTLQLVIFGVIVLLVVGGFVTFIASLISKPLAQLTDTASRIANGETGLMADTKSKGEIATLAKAFNSMTAQLQSKAEAFGKANEILKKIIESAKQIIASLNSASKEIEAAAQEQTSATNEHASGITEVSATLQELTITAKQISKNVSELVFSSEEMTKLLRENEKQLLSTASQLDDVGNISKNNALQIGELGKRSIIINEMVELIKEIANKTNILSINASIEASRSGEAGAGFSVVAAEIRELSKETIESAKKTEKAAKEIQDFLNSIIISSENESGKVVESGKTVKSISDSIKELVAKINTNFSFTQKIEVSIKQQENGSIQAAETMRQMAEIARQSAETSRQMLQAGKSIVELSVALETTVVKSEI